MKYSEESPWDLRDTIKQIIDALWDFAEEKKLEAETFFNEIMAETFPNLESDKSIQIPETQRSPKYQPKYSKDQPKECYTEI